MYEKVKKYIEKHQMFQNVQAVIAGVSGGGDSMAMLHMLKELREEYGFYLRVVHVHHGIRGKEADRDQSFVENICAEWEIPCSVYKFNVPELAKRRKQGEEETGRSVRKEAFEKEIRRFGEDTEGCEIRIALAHNQNDLAETMLHNLARGTGLGGLASMKAVSGKMIRPLLCLEREKIDQYLKENNICYLTDSTNLSDQYTRNRIRHRVLSVIKEDINEKAVSHMAEASEKIAMADAYFRKLGRKLAEKCRTDTGEVLLTEEFWQEEEIVQSYAIMEIFEMLAGQKKDFTQDHVRQIIKCRNLQTGKKAHLPYGILIKKDYQGIVIKKQEFQKECVFMEYVWDPKDGQDSGGEKTIYLEDGTLFAKVFSYEGQKILEKKYTKWFDYDKIQNRLSVRNRKSGDFIIMDEEGRRKKLTRYMIDEKIPQEYRSAMPLLTCGSEVIWVIGGRISEKYKIDRNTKKVLEVKYQGGHGNE